jgi:hypothetical protein
MKKYQLCLKKEIKLITILTGDAPSQHNDQPVTLSERFQRSARFIEGRRRFTSKKHCMVSKTDAFIKLVLNEQSVVDRYTYKEKLRSQRSSPSWN